MNAALKSFTNYLKYEGVQVEDDDAAKILDLYMRITIVLSTGNDVHTGLNVIFTGKNNLDFSSIDTEGINSIVNYVITTSDTVADHKIGADTMNSIIDGGNIVKTLNAAHLFIGTIIGLEAESLMKTDHPEMAIDLRQFSFVNHNSDGTCLSISGYMVKDDSGENKVIYDFISNALVDGIPDEVIYV